MLHASQGMYVALISAEAYRLRVCRFSYIKRRRLEVRLEVYSSKHMQRWYRDRKGDTPYPYGFFVLYCSILSFTCSYFFYILLFYLHLSLYLSIFSIYLSFYTSLSLLFIYSYIFLSIFSTYLFILIFLYFYFYLSLFTLFSLFLYFSIFLSSLYLSIFLFLSLSLPIYPYYILYLYISIYPTIVRFLPYYI